MGGNIIDMERSFRGRKVTRHGGGVQHDRHGKIFQGEGGDKTWGVQHDRRGKLFQGEGGDKTWGGGGATDRHGKFQFLFLVLIIFQLVFF